MKVIIDRFEGEYAIVEAEGKRVQLARALVPEAKEGDVVRIEIDATETLQRKQGIKELMDQLFCD